ncbi:hypothetical protein Trydic_g15395 [Trypoxylus dichotomus]
MTDQTEVKYYKLEEIKLNNGANGAECWIIYKNKVYNVTSYVDEHPGGPELVTEWGGKDSTKAFDDAGHSSDARNMLKPFKIGELALEDRNVKKAKSPKSPDAQVRRSFISIVTCGLCG